MGNEAFTEAQEKQIVEVIRATVAEVLRQQEVQKRRGDTEPQMRTAAYIERQREQSRSERSRPPNTATRSARCSTAWARSCWATRSRPHRLRPLRPRKHIHQFGPVFAPPLCDAKQHPASVQVFVRGIIVGSFKDLAHIGKIEIHEITPLWGL